MKLKTTRRCRTPRHRDAHDPNDVQRLEEALRSINRIMPAPLCVVDVSDITAPGLPPGSRYEIWDDLNTTIRVVDPARLAAALDDVERFNRAFEPDFPELDRSPGE